VTVEQVQHVKCIKRVAGVPLANVAGSVGKRIRDVNSAFDEMKCAHFVRIFMLIMSLLARFLDLNTRHMLRIINLCAAAIK
jgi:hypothetical protein